jgi:hypothetical protein
MTRAHPFPPRARHYPWRAARREDNVIHSHGTRFIASAFLVAVAAAGVSAQGIAPEERSKIVEYLTNTRNQVIAESAELSEAQWNFKEAPERWSVGEVVEHLALAEEFLFGAEQKIVASPAATPEQRAATKGKDEIILKAVPDRTKKAQAPEPIRPSEKLEGQRTVVSAFRERREKTLAYAGKTTDDLRARVGDSPLGPVDGYQWLLFIGAHTERHLAQIREVKANAQFPKK